MIFYVALLFFLFDYLRPGNYVPGLDALRLNAIIPMTAILGTLVLKTPVSNKQFFEEPNTRIMAVLLSLLAISTLIADVTMTAFTVTKNVFAYMLVYWVLVRQIGDLRRLSMLFVTLAGVHLLVAALNPALFTNPDSRVGVNSGGFLGDGNDFSLSVNICIPLLLFVLMESKRRIVQLAWALGLVALVLAVVATKSRGGTLALGALMLYFWSLSQRKALMAGVFVLVVGVILVAAPSSYYERMSTMTDPEEGSAAGRIEAWQEGTWMAIRNPLLGAGAGHFPLAFGKAKGGRFKTAHSIYFLLLGELGIPGITVLLTFIFMNFNANRRLLGEVRKLPPDKAATASNALTCTSAALVAYCTGGAFLSAAYYPHMYVLAGMFVAARRVVRAELAAHENADQSVVAQPARPRVVSGTINPEWRPQPALLPARSPRLRSTHPTA